MAPNSVLNPMEDRRDAGHIRHIAIAPHRPPGVIARSIAEYPFESALIPAGISNLAYDYSFVDTVLPIARSRGMAVLGMKVMGAGRIKHARSIEPYLRYGLSQPIDTAVIGADTIAQLEANVRIAMGDLNPLSMAEI